VDGRKADTIGTGGENVAPAEVEVVLEAHPGVLEAAVLGRSDPQWGEAVTALVVARPGVQLEAQALREHCARSLAPYKVPKQVVSLRGRCRALGLESCCAGRCDELRPERPPRSQPRELGGGGGRLGPPPGRGARARGARVA